MVYTQPPWRGGGARRAGGATRVEDQPMPVGRVGPLSSGISTRTLPAASIEEIRRACDHYERKCSGRYHDNVAAARHLRDLANEVRTLLEQAEIGLGHGAQRDTRAASNRIFSEWVRCFGPESDFYTHDDPASVLGVSPEAIRARLDAQTQELERLRAEVVELRRKTAEDRREYQAQVNVFASAARAAARQEGAVKDDKLTLQRLRHERETARVHAHYQAQLEALQAEVAQACGQQQQQQQGQEQQQQQQGPAGRTARQRQARGPEATSAAAFVAGGEGPAPAFVPPQPPATAEEAAYLKKRLADVQELFDLVRTATDSAAAGKEGAGGRAARPSTATARASTATTALPLAYDPCDPGFGGVDVYEQQPEPLATAAATARTARGRLPSVTLAGTPAAGRTLRSAAAAASTTPAALRTPAASRRLDPSLYPATSTINASFTAGPSTIRRGAMGGEGVREALAGFAAAEDDEEGEEEEWVDYEGQWGEEDVMYVEEEGDFSDESDEGEEEEEEEEEG